MTKAQLSILAALLLTLGAGCVRSNGGGGDDDDDDDGAPPVPAGDDVPDALVGDWYAGAGGTTSPYDPSTGQYGMPNGQGLLYQFEPDGSYVKAFQSYESAGGCSTGFTAFERGPLEIDGARIVTHPISGTLKYTATCSPDLDSEEPIENLTDEVFEWSFVQNELDPAETDLWLRRDDGSEGTFRRL